MSQAGSPPNQSPPPNPSAAGRRPRIKLGELLVQAGVLAPEQLEHALRVQAEEGGRRRLGRVLVEQGFVEETMLTQCLGRQLSVPWVSLYHVDFSRQLLNLVPREVAEQFTLIPVYVRHVRGQGETLYVATDDPTNEEALRRVSAFAALPVRAMIASASDIKSAIRVYYGVPPVPHKPPSIAAPTLETPAEVAATLARPPSSPPAPQRPSPAAVVQPEPGEGGSAARPASTAVPTATTAVGTSAGAPVPSAAPTTGPVPVTKPSPTQPGAGAPTPRVAPPLPPSPPSPASPASTSNPKSPEPSSRPATTPAATSPASESDGAPASGAPQDGKAKRRAISLTFLDGTTISLPAPIGARGRVVPPTERESDSQLTARDLVSALRAVSHGAEASEILGDHPRWEAMFAALLSLLLRKHLIADWEFVEEYRKY